MAYVKQIKAKNSSTATSDTTFDIKAMAVEKDAAVQNSANDMSAGAVVRNISYGTAAPSGGYNGDIYMQYGSSTILDLIYPVGSIYLSLSESDPNTLFPGTTWSKIEDTFLLGKGTNYTSAVGTLGGNSTQTLTVEQLPSHGHGVHIDYNDSNTTNRSVVGWYGSTNPGGSVGVKTSPTYYAQNSRITIENTGGGQSFSIMPPYTIVNMWHRTA